MLNQLVRERLSGVFILHFVQSEQMYPVYLEFGYNHDLLAMLATEKNNDLSKGKNMCVKFFHQDLWHIKK